MALVARSASGLRKVFHAFEGFCIRENLTISRDKTKVVIKDPMWQENVFHVNDYVFEVVDSFKYLGIPIDQKARESTMI